LRFGGERTLERSSQRRRRTRPGRGPARYHAGGARGLRPRQRGCNSERGIRGWGSVARYEDLKLLRHLPATVPGTPKRRLIHVNCRFAIPASAGLGDHKIITTLCPGGKERMRRLMNVIQGGRADLKPLVTHRFKLDDIERAYELFSNQRDGVLKVAITP